MSSLEILAAKWNEKYSIQPYEKHHLHHNYEDLVLKAMEEYASIKAKEEAIGFFVWYGVRMVKLIKEVIASRLSNSSSEEMNNHVLNHEGKTLEELYAKYKKEVN